MSAVMPTSARSRLAASATSFLLGFVIANLGLLAVPRPDTWVWLVAGAILMATGAVGVLISDSPRDISVWAILGLELFAVFTIIPLLWTFSVATASPDMVRTTLVPTSPDWSAFGEVLAPGRLRDALLTSVIVAGGSTVLAIIAAVPVAYVLTHRPVAGRTWWQPITAAMMAAPVAVFAAPAAAQLLDFGWSMSRLAMALPTVLVSLPPALFLLINAFSRARWSFDDALVANGASRGQRLRYFAGPELAGDIAIVAVMVFAWTVSDYAMGAGLAATDQVQPLSAALFDVGAQSSSSRQVAAAGLWWLLPLTLFGAVFSRRIISLLGRS